MTGLRWLPASGNGCPPAGCLLVPGGCGWRGWRQQLQDPVRRVWGWQAELSQRRDGADLRRALGMEEGDGSCSLHPQGCLWRGVKLRKHRVPRASASVKCVVEGCNMHSPVVLLLQRRYAQGEPKAVGAAGMCSVCWHGFCRDKRWGLEEMHVEFVILVRRYETWKEISQGSVKCL